MSDPAPSAFPTRDKLSPELKERLRRIELDLAFNSYVNDDDFAFYLAVVIQPALNKVFQGTKSWSTQDQTSIAS